jgi:hypothetical protein
VSLPSTTALYPPITPDPLSVAPVAPVAPVPVVPCILTPFAPTTDAIDVLAWVVRGVGGSVGIGGGVEALVGCWRRW